jgi:hypothetical protein
MTEPGLNIIGIYRPQISAETWQEQLEVTGDEAYTKEHFSKLAAMGTRRVVKLPLRQ